MAIRVSRYTAPGVYIQQETIQPIPAFVGLPRQICLIGEGEEAKTVVDEHHIRAYITEEVETPDSGGVFVLAKQSDLKASTMYLFKNGDQQAVDQFTIEQLIALACTAALPGVPVPGNVENGTHSYRVSFVIGGLESAQGAKSNVVTVVDKTVNGQVNLTVLPLGPTGTTARKIYRSTAGDVGPWKLLVTIANNTTTTYTDNTADAGLGANALLYAKVTKVTISAATLDLTADYTFSYQSLVFDPDDIVPPPTYLNDKDILLTDITATFGRILSVGSFPGTKNFVDGSDYEIDVANNAIKWLAAAAAVITGANAETFNMGTLPKTLKVTVDGGAEQSITFVTADFVNPVAATALEIQTKINAILTGALASVSGGKVVITSATSGVNSSITIGGGTSNIILGFMTGSMAQGTGKNPAQGEEFYITYQSERPDDEYNRPILTTSFDQLIARIGGISSTNALALAGQIVYEQNPPFVYHIQVKNTGTGAAAQDIDYVDAIKGAELNPDLTDIIVLGYPTSNGGGKKPVVRAALREHITDQSGLLAKAERIGWFGMAVGTEVGDGETPGTFVYVATQELQVSADSPARGRFVLTAPSYGKKTYRYADGTVKQLTLDSTYLAAGVAALNASFLSPAEGLLRKEVIGFDQVEELDIGDRDFLAGNGLNVIQARAGRNVIFDPQSTDQSSDEFREINVMNQKDNIVKRVRRSVDDSLVGVVPDSLSQFVYELKSLIASELNASIADGAIAPFQNDDGTPRNINLSDDIIVRRRDATTYDFRFAFFAKFIVKRLYGTFSVLVPSGS